MGSIIHDFSSFALLQHDKLPQFCLRKKMKLLETLKNHITIKIDFFFNSWCENIGSVNG